MNIAVLLTFNILNGYLFWVMWRGFYLNGSGGGIFYKMLVFQLLVTFFSFVAYGIRNKPIALKLAPGSVLGKSDVAAAKITALTGAYGLSVVNLIVAITLYSINGTIDIWVSGNEI